MKGDMQRNPVFFKVYKFSLFMQEILLIMAGSASIRVAVASFTPLNQKSGTSYPAVAESTRGPSLTCLVLN